MMIVALRGLCTVRSFRKTRLQIELVWLQKSVWFCETSALSTASLGNPRITYDGLQEKQNSAW
jgi:hypothetical protein